MDYTQTILVLFVVGVFIAAVYWFVKQGATPLEPDFAPVPIEERAPEVKDETDLNASSSELDATNLGQIDVELKAVEMEISN